MNYSETVAAERRLAILRLIRDGGGSANRNSLYNAAIAIGYPLTTRDDILADIDLLGERGCVTRDMYLGKILVAILTDLGRDVADGKREVEDVKAGEPGR